MRHPYLSILTVGQLVDQHCLKNSGYVSLSGWDTICVPCHNGIVHSHHCGLRKMHSLTHLKIFAI